MSGASSAGEKKRQANRILALQDGLQKVRKQLKEHERLYALLSESDMPSIITKVCQDVKLEASAKEIVGCYAAWNGTVKYVIDSYYKIADSKTYDTKKTEITSSFSSLEAAKLNYMSLMQADIIILQDLELLLEAQLSPDNYADSQELLYRLIVDIKKYDEIRKDKTKTKINIQAADLYRICNKIYIDLLDLADELEKTFASRAKNSVYGNKTDFEEFKELNDKTNSMLSELLRNSPNDPEVMLFILEKENFYEEQQRVLLPLLRALLSIKTEKEKYKFMLNYLTFSGEMILENRELFDKVAKKLKSVKLKSVADNVTPEKKLVATKDNIKPKFKKLKEDVPPVVTAASVDTLTEAAASASASSPTIIINKKSIEDKERELAEKQAREEKKAALQKERLAIREANRKQRWADRVAALRESMSESSAAANQDEEFFLREEIICEPHMLLKLQDLFAYTTKSVNYDDAVSLIERLGGKVKDDAGGSHQTIIFEDCVCYATAASSSIVKKTIKAGFCKPHGKKGSDLVGNDLALLREAIRKVIDPKIYAQYVDPAPAAVSTSKLR